MGAKEDFVQKVRSAKWDEAANQLNVSPMYDILPYLWALGPDRAIAVQNIVGTIQMRGWSGSADRLYFASEVLRTQNVPTPPPGLPADQVLDAQRFLQGLKAAGLPTPFDIDMASPFRSGWTGPLGGPGLGGHNSTDWFVQFGMDLGVRAGTEVYAVFGGHVDTFNPDVPHPDHPSVYGVQIWIHSPNDKVDAYYTHFNGVNFTPGQEIQQGQLLGKIMVDHLHLAVAEVVGGKPTGVNLYAQFLDLRDTAKEITVKFKQNGSPPTVV